MKMKTRTLFVKDCIAKFHPSFGNEKLGGKNYELMAISYMPSNDFLHFSNGELVTDCIGTCNMVDCSQCSKKCYAINTVKRFHHTALKGRVENTLQLRFHPDEHFEDIRKTAIKKGVKVIRYTESGEITSYVHFLRVVSLAQHLPTVKIYLYTKYYGVLKEYFNHSVLPTNLTVLVSVWGETGVKEWQELKKYNGVKCFAVNSDLNPQVYCPAYIKNAKGKTVRNYNAPDCAKCGLCFSSKAKIIGCLEH